MRVVRALLYLSYLISAVLMIIYFFFYRPFVADLRDRGGNESFEQVRHVSARTMNLLGSINTDPALHFTKFSTGKSPGVTRLCALGDSNTAGNEAGPGLDYPSYLQRQLFSLGAHNVEVINFGNGWFGFSQIAVMWQDVASRFDCDVVVILYYPWWWERDTTFNHTNLHKPYYLHARHAVVDNALNLIEVEGASKIERFERYFGFVPLWRYLRYDRNPPAAVRSLVPSNLEIQNPFYSASDPRTEAKTIHYHLLAAVAEYDTPIVVMSNYGNQLEPFMHLERENVSFAVRHGAEPGFPFRAPIWHRSGWGNEMMAGWIAQVLLGVQAPDVPRLEFNGVKGDANWPKPVPLNSASALTLNIAGKPVGALVSINDRLQGEENRHRQALADSPYGGLLALRTPEASPLNACLLPLRHLPSPGDRVLVERSGAEPVDLGPVEAVAPGLAVWQVAVAGAQCSGSGLRVKLDNNSKHGTATLRIGGEAFATNRIDGKLEILGEVFRFRAFGHYAARVDSLPGSGTVTLVLEVEQGEREFVISNYRVENDGPGVEVLRQGEFGMRIEGGRAYVTAGGS